ncbi:LysM peptidoglycan-binding domain-containing protein [Metabacillus herbersteinensis]|uniref:Autolysin n=1 Tax=Metabacillus herbersteinensis TaxID=283816 RepID=A0ABV6GAB7_9BACI
MKKNTVLVISLILIMLINISPSHAAGNKTSNIYVVKSGDTLSGIANKNGTSIRVLKATNGLTSDQIYLGQKLKLTPKKMTVQGQYILMTKEEFRNWLFHNKFNRKISIIQHHHTWLPSYKQFNGSNHFEMLKGMENYHVKKMGWKNIAQNITTFPDGKVAVSRPFNVAPEGTIGLKANSSGIAIENVGNFDIGHDVMTAEQKETIVYVTALLSIKFGLTPSIDSITYHHWWNLKTGERVLDRGAVYDVKTCPGTGFFGGNSTNSATNYFYPLVSRKIQEILASMH